MLGETVGKHWYYRAKAAAMVACLQGVSARRVVDVGAGSGFFSAELLRLGLVEEACCVDPFYQEEGERCIEGSRQIFRRRLDGHAAADLYLFMDVLEHVVDDRKILQDYMDRAPSGSHVFLSVPAFQSLWSSHDVYLEHYRRYRLTQLESLVEEAGLEVLRGHYFFGTVFPLAALIRLIGRLRGNIDFPQSHLSHHSRPVNSVLYQACRMETPFMRMNRLAGLSVFCLACK